jgi:hypothetical protein
MTWQGGNQRKPHLSTQGLVAQAAEDHAESDDQSAEDHEEDSVSESSLPSMSSTDESPTSDSEEFADNEEGEEIEVEPAMDVTAKSSRARAMVGSVPLTEA